MSTEKVDKTQFEEVIKRLMVSMGIKNEYKLAEFLGFKKDTFSARKKRGALPVDKIRLLCADKGINFNWVMSGQGQGGASVILEETAPYGSGYIDAVASMMRDMDEEMQKDIFLSVQKEKLLRELLTERQGRKAPAR